MKLLNPLPRPDYSPGYDFVAQRIIEKTFNAETTRIIREALAAGDPLTAVAVVREVTTAANFGELSLPEKVDNWTFVQRLTPTETFWRRWAEVKRVLTGYGWRVKKDGDNWIVQVYTGLKQVEHFASRHTLLVLRTLPKGVTPLRYAGGRGRGRGSGHLEDYILRSKLRGEFEALEAEGYGDRITDFDRREEEKANQRENQ